MTFRIANACVCVFPALNHTVAYVSSQIEENVISPYAVRNESRDY